MVRRIRAAGKWQAAPPKEFVQAVCHCIGMLTAVLKARVSDKSRFLANSASLLKNCLAEFEKKGLKRKGTGASVARYLGIDYSAVTQVSGCRPTRKKRFVSAKRKRHRAKRLKKAGADVNGVWMAGPATSVSYGAEIYGVNGGTLEAARKVTGAVVLPGGGGRSLTRGFLVAKKQFMDPICREGVAPIHAWCAEAWQRRERQGPMKTAWRYAERAVTGAARPWSRVRGPASAA